MNMGHGHEHERRDAGLVDKTQQLHDAIRGRRDRIREDEVDQHNCK